MEESEERFFLTAKLINISVVLSQVSRYLQRSIFFNEVVALKCTFVYQPPKNFLNSYWNIFNSLSDGLFFSFLFINNKRIELLIYRSSSLVKLSLFQIKRYLLIWSILELSSRFIWFLICDCISIKSRYQRENPCARASTHACSESDEGAAQDGQRSCPMPRKFATISR